MCLYVSVNVLRINRIGPQEYLIYAVACLVRGRLDRKKSEEHLQSSNESIKKQKQGKNKSEEERKTKKSKEKREKSSFGHREAQGTDKNSRCMAYHSIRARPQHNKRHLLRRVWNGACCERTRCSPRIATTLLFTQRHNFLNTVLSGFSSVSVTT